MFRDPRRRLDVLVEPFIPRAWPSADGGVVRVRLASEGDHSRLDGYFWLDKPSLDPFRNAMNLEAAAPLVGPESHFLDIARDVSL